jgi:hypothetical protein
MRSYVLSLLAAAVLAAGCSSAGPPGGSSAPGRPPGTLQSDREMVAFAGCMRRHGVQMSDPAHRPGHTGLSIDLPTRDSATRLAYAACTHFIQPIISAKQAGAASQAAPHLAALTRYARCMRAHDINMLDPTSYGALNLGTVPGISASFGRYSPQFRSADAACRRLLPRGVHDNGTGP